MISKPSSTWSDMPIPPDTALELEMVLGIDAYYWANLESLYRMTLARQRAQDELVAGVAALNCYPIREMTKRKWIKVGELEARNACTAAYDAEAFRQALLDIRRLTQQPLKEFIPTISALCAGAGGAFCLVPELPRSGANGVARWLPDGQALIQMSLRHKWADVFWFSFFHEACHILRHRAQRRIVVDGLGRDPDLTEMEAEADAFASDMLIPPGSWQDFCNDCEFSLASTREFALSVEIAPFVVVGRLQKEKRIGYNQLATLKARYERSDL